MKPAAVVLVFTVGLLPAGVRAQIVPPKPGTPLPQAYLERKAQDPKAFQFQKAWIAKSARAKAARQELRAHRGKGGHAGRMMNRVAPQETMVAGTIRVPVILIKYNNTASDPYPSSDLQAKLFDGPNATGTITDVYREMSYNNLTMTGTVYPVAPAGWVQAAHDDVYYEGGQNGLSPCSSKTGELILEALSATDSGVDFGIYDNDGPDGIANSGDDDGFVDFVAIVQPEIGAECNTSNMWSHRWVVGGWPEFGAVYAGGCALQQMGSPYLTNDASANGGPIRIWDYTIQPALGSSNGCGGGIIEVGVFCHEFGHSLGLPDLYDTDGGGQGIGVHGLMGSGNWNQPTNPAHMCAWSKAELGWVDPIMVGKDPQSYAIDAVELNPNVYQLNVNAEKFARQDSKTPSNPVTGDWSLICGLDAAAAGARNWPGGEGYGNGWNETVEREFTFDGTTPVTLQYDAFYHTEANYDFGRVSIEINNTIAELKTYTGIGVATTESIDLTPHLAGSGATDYRIVFSFDSDASFSDEDGDFDSGTNGPFKLDRISVMGGGESYSSDFEQDDGGWVSTTPPTEFFLVENRNRSGQFDKFLHAEGLYIWHVEQNVAHSTLGNTSGTAGRTNLRPAGVTLMEADGFWQLLQASGNRGDAGDAYPGSTGNTTFDGSSAPSSASHNGTPTNVFVTNISAPGLQMSALMRADDVLLDTDPPPGPAAYSLVLDQNVPNPFNPSTTIRFSLPIASSVSLNVYDVAGRLVVNLVNDYKPAGPQQVTWDGTTSRGGRAASGVYFYQLVAGGQTISKKMMLIH